MEEADIALYLTRWVYYEFWIEMVVCILYKMDYSVGWIYTGLRVIILLIQWQFQTHFLLWYYLSIYKRASILLHFSALRRYSKAKIQYWIFKRKNLTFVWTSSMYTVKQYLHFKSIFSNASYWFCDAILTRTLIQAFRKPLFYKHKNRNPS